MASAQPDGEVAILLISGSLRADSVNTSVLRTVAKRSPEGVQARLYEELGSLPHFNPDHDAEGMPLHGQVQALRRQLSAADGLLLCTPEYAGGMPGSFKNMLDWTVGGGETYGKPVAWINASSRPDPQAAAGAHSSLRSVLTYTGTDIVEDACLRVTVPRSAIVDGIVVDESICESIMAAFGQLLARAGARASEDRAAPVETPR